MFQCLGFQLLDLALAYYFFTTESKKLSTNENVTFEEGDDWDE